SRPISSISTVRCSWRPIASRGSATTAARSTLPTKIFGGPLDLRPVGDPTVVGIARLSSSNPPGPHGKVLRRLAGNALIYPDKRIGIIRNGIYETRLHRPRRLAHMSRLHELWRGQSGQPRLEPRRGGKPPVYQEGARSRHQFFRYRQSLLARQQRGNPRL